MIKVIFALAILIFILLLIYVGRALQRIFPRWAQILFYSVGGLSVLLLIWNFAVNFSIDWNPFKSYSFGVFLTIYLTLIAASFVLFVGDIFNFLTKITQKTSQPTIESRRKFTTKLGLGLAAVPFSSFIYGMVKGRFDYRVIQHNLYFEDLPDAFDGYQITHISDIHSGSLLCKDKISYAVDLINEQNSDIILFTGDIVNNKADELLPWKEVFKKLKAKGGVYSVLGNHDYGDYVPWNSEEEKKENLEQLKAIQKEIGFDLLMDEHRYLEKNGQKIALLGVQNWGAGRFAKYGNLDKALENLSDKEFKILMSHDPTHWEHKVLKSNKTIHLTLSGHTHGMQFGIEIPGWIKWSPAQWQYKQWAGVYEKSGKYINVNRGFGVLAFPGRVGMPPEITIIKLNKK